MNSRGNKWLVFLVSGGYGWYQSVLPVVGLKNPLPGWVTIILFLVAIGGGLWSATPCGNDVEAIARQWMNGWWKELHYYARERKKNKMLKWILAPVLLWILPLLLGLFGLGGIW
jgi:hypothetical protein